MQYVEIYNYGHTITDMSIISLSGFATGALPATQLSQGSLGVIYNTEINYVQESDIPDCTDSDCSCTVNANTNPYPIRWCDDAIYMGCCDDPALTCADDNYAFEQILSNCQFDQTQTNSQFNITLIYNGIIIEEVSFNNDPELTKTATNYSLELKNKGILCYIFFP